MILACYVVLILKLSLEVLKNIRTVRQLTNETYFINCYERTLLEPHRYVIKHLNI